VYEEPGSFDPYFNPTVGSGNILERSNHDHFVTGVSGGSLEASTGRSKGREPASYMHKLWNQPIVARQKMKPQSDTNQLISALRRVYFSFGVRLHIST
jgi:hypothetical protein